MPKRKKLKVLMITPYLPYPPFSGGQTRSFYLLKHLAKDVDITLFSFLLPDQTGQNIQELNKLCRRVRTFSRGKTWQWRKILFTGFSPYPFLVANYFSPALKQALRQELQREKYDLIHVECFYLMPNIPKTKTPVLLVDQTIEFAVYQHYVASLPWWRWPLKLPFYFDVAKLKFWEVHYWRRANRLAAVSEEDQKIMEKLSRRAVDIVPNGVNERFLKLKPLPKYRQPTVLFGVANFKWLQNKEGARKLLLDIWPRVKQAVPEARLLVAGKYARDFLYRKGFLPGQKDVWAGEVEDVSQTYRRSWLLLAPMASGGGSRTKFFEAMSLGLPIVTTPEGIEGIRAKWGRDVLVGKNDQEIIDLAVKLLRNKEQQRRIGQAGRRLILKYYTWSKSARALYRIYRDLSQ